MKLTLFSMIFILINLISVSSFNQIISTKSIKMMKFEKLSMVDNKSKFYPFDTSLNAVNNKNSYYPFENNVKLNYNSNSNRNTRLNAIEVSDRFGNNNQNNKKNKSNKNIVNDINKENFMESDGFWRLVILGIAFSWATNFPVIKVIYDTSPTLDASLYSALRFGIAGLLFVPTAFNGFMDNKSNIFKSLSLSDKNNNRDSITSTNNSDSIDYLDLMLGAAFIGFILFAGYYGQAIGLVESSAGKGAFICTLQIVFVALVSGWQKQEYKASTFITVSLALAGTALLELKGSQAPVLSDLWLGLQPLGFGGGYILLERLITKYPNYAREITAWKLLSIAFFTTIWAAMDGHTSDDILLILNNSDSMKGVLYCAVVTTALTIWLQSVAFKRVSANDASIIIATEPVWAALVGFICLGERMSEMDMGGALLISASGLGNELNWFSFADDINGNNNKNDKIKIK